jgi:type II secretory pathway pseudopilin PulG
MKFTPARRPYFIKRAVSAFTLAEVLAAMLFMAIVIPIAVQGIRLASLAGEVSEHKLIAARIGNKVLNELKVMGQLQNSARSGAVQNNGVEYDWSVRSSIWTEDATSPMTLVTLTVAYTAQGKKYDVKLSTLVPQNATL